MRRPPRDHGAERAPQPRQDRAAHRDLGGTQLVVLDHVRAADVDRPEALGRLLTNPPEVRLAHPRDRVVRERSVAHELGEAEQVIGLVGAAERRHRGRRGADPRLSARSAGAAPPRASTLRVAPPPSSGAVGNTKQPATPAAIARHDEGERPGRARRLRHMWFEQHDARCGRRVGDEVPAHVERPRPASDGGSLDRRGSAPVCGLERREGDAPAPRTSTAEVEAGRAVLRASRAQHRPSAGKRAGWSSSDRRRALAANAQPVPRTRSSPPAGAGAPSRRSKEELQLVVARERAAGRRRPELRRKKRPPRRPPAPRAAPRRGVAARRARDERRAQRDAGALGERAPRPAARPGARRRAAPGAATARVGPASVTRVYGLIPERPSPYCLADERALALCGRDLSPRPAASGAQPAPPRAAPDALVRTLRAAGPGARWRRTRAHRGSWHTRAARASTPGASPPSAAQP